MDAVFFVTSVNNSDISNLHRHSSCILSYSTLFLLDANIKQLTEVSPWMFERPYMDFYVKFCAF